MFNFNVLSVRRLWLAQSGRIRYAIGLTRVEVEQGTIRLCVNSQGSPVESRYLTSAKLYYLRDSVACCHHGDLLP